MWDGFKLWIQTAKSVRRWQILSNFYFVRKSGATKYGPGYIQMAAQLVFWDKYQKNAYSWKYAHYLVQQGLENRGQVYFWKSAHLKNAHLKVY